jgi:tetratricopeptide (TPR) repeat protein
MIMGSEDEMPFEEMLLSWLRKDVNPLLAKNGILDARGNLDKKAFMAKFDEGMKSGFPLELNAAIDNAPSIATAHEYLGDMERAMQYYWVGTFIYTHQLPASPKETREMVAELRGSYATLQLTAAICSDRIGNRGRAVQLFEWAAAHLAVTDGEKDQFRREGNYNMVWEYAIDRAFCLLCLERWQEALGAGEEAERWVKMDTDRREKFGEQYAPFHLLPVYHALAKYRAHPTPDNEMAARKRLMLSEFKVRENRLRHGALLYIFELWARNLNLLK